MGDTARVCQFFLRGRCQRQKCEFRHPADLVEKEKEKRPNGNDRPSSGATDRETCKFYLSTGCKFGANCHFKHVGRVRRRSRSRSRERRYRSDSEDERRGGDSSDEEVERRKRDRRKREEKDKEYQRRKLRMEERIRDLKSKESRTSVRERNEHTYGKRSVLKHAPSRESVSRNKSKSPSKKGNLKSEIKVSKPVPSQSTLVTNRKPSPSKPTTSPPSSSTPQESRCSKCGQKVAKRRATS